jgi:hypothetical protein
MEGPATGAVAEGLQRLLASSQFSDSLRAARFLRFIVESVLGGRNGLKEYVLGVEVFRPGNGRTPGGFNEALTDITGVYPCHREVRFLPYTSAELTLT